MNRGGTSRFSNGPPSESGNIPAPPAAPLAPLVNALLESYRSDSRGHRINRVFLPSRDEIIDIVRLLVEVMFPGYYGRQDLTDDNVAYHIGGVLGELREKLATQIKQCLGFQGETTGATEDTTLAHARATAEQFLKALPSIRAVLLEDAGAAFEGDPAATNIDEVILAYPGFLAVVVYRLAHALHQMDVPVMPRIMSEWAHSETGVDIHPGATIGERFFIDHGTGVVIGETTVIGRSVKLYQGVTLGALSLPRDSNGRLIRDTKRHPTVGDGVTVYANAIVLGGETNIAEGSTVGGSVFLTRSVPPHTRVAIHPPELSLKTRESDYDI